MFYLVFYPIKVHFASCTKYMNKPKTPVNPISTQWKFLYKMCTLRVSIKSWKEVNDSVRKKYLTLLIIKNRPRSMHPMYYK